MSDLFDTVRIPKRRGRPPLTAEERADRSARAAKAARRSNDKADRTSSRFLLEPLSGRQVTLPPYDAHYIVDGVTKYPSTRTDPLVRVLKSGKNQSKLGETVLTGRWQGMPQFCLTLEERATCPDYCPMWRSCYGNHMHLAQRFNAGPALEARIEREVAGLAAFHDKGFTVRLHILGDFYSVEYVALWATLLARHPELHVWGYTARWHRDDPIAQALLKLAHAQWDRFAMRFSNAPIDTCSTITIDHLGQKPADAIVCPVQLGQTESCSTCALCWQTDRRIAFIRH